MRRLRLGSLVLVLCFAACGGTAESGGVTSTAEGSTTTVGETDTTTTTVAATTTSASTTTVVSPVGWQPVELDPETFGPGTGIGNVAFHPVDNSWVAIGTTIPAEVREEEPRWYCFERGLCPVSVWSSPDGVAWIRVLELAPGSFVSDLTDVLGAPGPLYPTMLAAGAVYDESSFPPRPVPAVWHLDFDGTAAATPVDDDDLDAVAGQINGIVGMPFGYAAVGWRCPDDSPDCYGSDCFAEGRKPAIWVSEDGHDWRLAAVDFGEVAGGCLNDVVGLWFVDPQGWVAVGGDNNQAFAVRGSTDGNWTAVNLPSMANPNLEYILEDGSRGSVSGPCSATGRAVTVGPDGRLVAVGPCVPTESFMPYVTSWASPNGVSWSQIQVPDGLDEPSWMRTVQWIGEECVAGGWLNEPEPDINLPAVWTSPDGLAWTRVVISDEPGGVQDIAVGDGTRLAVGGWDEALIWIDKG